MKIKKAMILAAGFGKRMWPITINTPKPLIKIGKNTLLENCILKLEKFGIEELAINTHYLSDKIQNYINEKKFSLNIKIFREKNILNTGGGIFNSTKHFGNNPFLVLNPDTIWNDKHISEFESLAKIYFDKKSTVILLVKKSKSYDQSFKGDFNLNNKGLVSRDRINKLIYIGAQIMDRSIFETSKSEAFSINSNWSDSELASIPCAYSTAEGLIHRSKVKEEI